MELSSNEHCRSSSEHHYLLCREACHFAVREGLSPSRICGSPHCRSEAVGFDIAQEKSSKVCGSPIPKEISTYHWSRGHRMAADPRIAGHWIYIARDGRLQFSLRASVHRH